MLDQCQQTAPARPYRLCTELRTRSRKGNNDRGYGVHDMKATADKAAEEQILPVLQRAFPDHTAFAREAGEFPGNECRWIIDPLTSS
jgi:myo-inositol-1(or 4)-monophosphatase